MKKILGLIIGFMLLTGMTGIGTWAYFSDTETSTGNILTAGTLDLTTNDANGVTQTLLATNMAPGDTVGPETITLENIGSVTGATLDLAFSYVESDGGTNPVNMTADETAAMLEVTTLDYGPDDLLLIGISDFQPNGYTDIEDLMNEDLSGLNGIDASLSKDFVIAVLLVTSTGNDFQADGITVTMTFTLNQ